MDYWSIKTIIIGIQENRAFLRYSMRMKSSFNYRYFSDVSLSMNMYQVHMWGAMPSFAVKIIYDKLTIVGQKRFDLQFNLELLVSILS